MYRLTLIALTLVTQYTVAVENFGCDLQWVDFASDQEIPPSAVPSHNDQVYVAKSPDETVGTFGKTWDRFLYVSLSSIGTVKSSGKILVNNNGCNLVWVQASHEDVSTFGVKNGNYFIARAHSKSVPTKWLMSGQVQTKEDGSLEDLKIAVDTSGIVESFSSDDYDILTSRSFGLVARIDDLTFEVDPGQGTPEMFGFEEMHNGVDANLSQTVTQSKFVEENYVFKSESSFHFAAEFHASACILVAVKCWGFDWNLNQLWSNLTQSDSTSFVQDTKLNITLSREIILGPFSDIQICSILSTVKNFETKWTGKAVFSYAGWTADKVEEYVKTQDEWQDKVFQHVQNSIETDTQGTFQGSFSLTSKFITSPTGNVGSCQEIQMYLMQQQQFKSSKFKQHQHLLDSSAVQQQKIRQIIQKGRRLLVETSGIGIQDENTLQSQ